MWRMTGGVFDIENGLLTLAVLQIRHGSGCGDKIQEEKGVVVNACFG